MKCDPKFVFSLSESNTFLRTYSRIVADPNRHRFQQTPSFGNCELSEVVK